ncbi:hypothetical protein ACJJTC_006373 [Scirpophaga incertulas]
MRSLILIAFLSLASAKPKPGGIWGQPAVQSVSYVQQPAVAVAQPVVHAAPTVYAKPAATSYASFQQVIHPVSVAQPVVHAAPVISQPVVHAPVVSQPVVQAVAQPVVQTVAQPVVHTVAQPVVQAVAQPVVHAPVVAQPVQTYQPYVSQIGHGW